MEWVTPATRRDRSELRKSARTLTPSCKIVLCRARRSRRFLRWEAGRFCVRTSLGAPARFPFPLCCLENPSVKIKILGSAAGGGFPQWNCGLPQLLGPACREDSRQNRATQTQIAFSARQSCLVPHWRFNRICRGQILAAPETRSQSGRFPAPLPLAACFFALRRCRTL